MSNRTIDQIIAEDSLSQNLAEVPQYLEKMAQAQHDPKEVAELVEMLEKTADYLEKAAEHSEDNMIYDNPYLDGIEDESFNLQLEKNAGWRDLLKRKPKGLIGKGKALLGKGTDKVKAGYEAGLGLAKKHPKKSLGLAAAGIGGGAFVGGRKKGRSETRSQLPAAYEKGLRRGFSHGMHYKGKSS